MELKAGESSLGEPCRPQSPEYIADRPRKEGNSPTLSRASSFNSTKEKSRHRRLTRVSRSGHIVDISARSGISKNVSQNPFITESRASKDAISHVGRAAALGTLRKEVFRISRKGRESPQLDFVFARNRASLISTPSISLREPSHQKPQEGSSAFEQLRESSPPKSPVSHEIVRNVGSRSQLDGGVPCDAAFRSAFIDCLEFVCEGNEDKKHAAYPRETAEGELISKVFPVEIARRYSPDFIHHLLDHMFLSRQSLAAALVYLDRAQSLNGEKMSVCNKNVNSLVLSALIIASRVIERRGYSDEILAMLAGYEDATSLRRAVAFFLTKLDGNAAVSVRETKPYEDLLDRLKPSAKLSDDLSEYERAHIESRSRAVQVHYPPSALYK